MQGAGVRAESKSDSRGVVKFESFHRNFTDGSNKLWQLWAATRKVNVKYFHERAYTFILSSSQYAFLKACGFSSTYLSHASTPFPELWSNALPAQSPQYVRF